VVFVIPTIFYASAIKLARAASYAAQSNLCDGVDDDTGASFLFALPEETMKRLSSMEPGAYPSANVSCLAIFRPRVTPAGTQLLSPSPDSPLRLKRILALRARSSGDPDDPH
jgi:hypothetical protein